MLNQSPELIIRRHIGESERLLWFGMPRQGIILQSSDAFLIPFTLLWCGFAIFWEYTAVSDGVNLFALFGIPFVLFGLNMTVGRFFYDARRRAHTCYGVTDERIIIITKHNLNVLASIDLQALPALISRERRDGSGSLFFEPQDLNSYARERVPEFYAAFVRNNTPRLLKFENIEHVRDVYAIIRSARGAA